MAETTATAKPELTDRLLEKEIQNKNESFSEAFLKDNPNYETVKELDIKAGNMECNFEPGMAQLNKISFDSFGKTDT